LLDDCNEESKAGGKAQKKHPKNPKTNGKVEFNGKEKSRMHHNASSFFCDALKMVFD
jgi:hypothetical protein